MEARACDPALVVHETPFLLRLFLRSFLEQAAFLHTDCAATFDACSFVDLALLYGLNFNTVIGFAIAFVQWSNQSPAKNLYYRITVTLGVFINLVVNTLFSGYIAVQRSPAPYPCGTSYAMPNYPVQLAFYMITTFMLTSVFRIEGVTMYQLFVAFLLVNMVVVAHVAFGYASVFQAAAGALLGGSFGLAWFLFLFRGLAHVGAPDARGVLGVLARSVVWAGRARAPGTQAVSA